MMESALVAAGVAAIVTLLIEYIAKPSLEARKERILAGHRDVRDVRSAWNRINFEIGRLLAWKDRDQVPADRLLEMAENIRRDALRIVDNLQQDNLPISDFEDDVLHYGTQKAELLAYLVEAGVGLDHVMAYAVDEAEPALDRACDALGLPWWRIRERRRVLRVIEVGKSDDDVPTQ